jgi:TRAP-type mannitol/chloroaromatic compound transport system permease small subunit
MDTTTDRPGENEDDNAIDRFSELTGRLTAWLTFFMVLVTFVVVVMRYVFDAGQIWLQESVTWMHAAVFMLGAAYTLKHEEHVRVDIFYGRASAIRKAWIDFLGVVLFLWPLCGFIAWSSLGFIETSWSLREASRESGGLPFPMLPILKTVLVIMPLALALQGASLMLKSLRTIRGS